MLFLRLADFTDTIETVVFPRLFASKENIFRPDACLILKGKVSLRNGETSIICEEVRELGEKSEAKKEVSAV